MFTKSYTDLSKFLLVGGLACHNKILIRGVFTGKKVKQAQLGVPHSEIQVELD